MWRFLGELCYGIAVMLVIWGFAVSATHEGSVIPFLGGAVIFAVLGVVSKQEA